AKAINYFTKSLTICEEIGDKKDMATSFIGIGFIYQNQGNYAKAKNYSLRALSIAQEIGAAIETRDASMSLSTAYNKLGNYKESLAMYELYITMRDSINSEENQKAVIRQELKYNYEKQADSLAIEQSKKEELALAEQQRKEDISAKENEKKNLIIYSGAGGLALLLIFTFFVISRLRVTRKQKKHNRNPKGRSRTSKKSRRNSSQRNRTAKTPYRRGTHRDNRQYQLCQASARCHPPLFE
ncbi:tetratricopeptide repeat protein, partial [Flavobacteriales bacterium]|nr:tetratricopeptide repeat protein [Flavobacteriales bacterium]